MSDVEVIDRAEIVRREVDRESMERALAVMDPAVLDSVFTSRDPRAVAERIAEVSTALMEAVRQRDLARRYGDNQSEFLHIEAWQYLATQLGMTVLGVGEERIKDPDGWMAWAELRHVATGRTLGARPGICDRSEPGKQRAPHNTILQMAHLRAARNATRSVLGFIPRIGGFEISDPDAPATSDQVGVLHQLERELGWSHDEGHDVASVDSYKNLTREQASELIEQWTALRDDVQSVKDRGTPGSGEMPVPRPSDVGEPEPQPVGEGRGKAQAVDTCSHPSWKRSEGVLRCTKCGVAKGQT